MKTLEKKTLPHEAYQHEIMNKLDTQMVKKINTAQKVIFHSFITCADVWTADVSTTLRNVYFCSYFRKTRL